MWRTLESLEVLGVAIGVPLLISLQEILRYEMDPSLGHKVLVVSTLNTFAM